MITFTGYKLSDLQKDVMAEAVSSALDVLVSKRMKRTLFFEINMVKDLYKARLVRVTWMLRITMKSLKSFMLLD